MARARQSQARGTTARRARRTSAAPTTTAASAASAILAWEDDPGQPPVTRAPIDRPEPNLSPGSLPIRIKDPAPPIGKHPLGTPEFRYWAAADALARAGEFWTTFLGATTWQTASRPKLPVALDEGTQFNAFYSRNDGGQQPGLHFFHGTALGTTLFSGESPDVVCHEFGHAVLDAVRPELWDAMAGEIAAFHESFGDMSAILNALRLRSFATRLFAETGGRLSCTSRLSRLAEQLGWGIRQCRPDAVAPDCLREAANSFFYQPPEQLPPQAPAAQLSSEPHSLSRVFTAAFLDSLAGMFALPQVQHDEDGLAAVAADAGKLLIEGVKASPVVPTYFSQVAIHILLADRDLNNGKYLRPFARGFVNRGILTPEQLSGPPPAEAPDAGARAAATEAPKGAALATITVPATRFGLKEDLQLVSASQQRRFRVAGAAPDTGSVDPVDHDTAAQGFFEDLVRRGRIDFGDFGVPAVDAPDTRKTHFVVRERRRLVVRRRYFDCGFDCCG